MADRASLPGELTLDAIIADPLRQIDASHQSFGEADYARMGTWDAEALERAKKRGPSIALRWVLNPALGIPLTPFTVWRRPAFRREKAVPIPGWHQTGSDTWGWDGVTEMLRIELDLSGPVTATGLQRADLQPVQTVSGTGGTTIVLDAGPMLGVRLDNPGGVAAHRGLALVTAANGDDWEPFEIAGLPFGPQLNGTTYYDGGPQGPIAALTDPVDAAIERLANWGPVLGWAPLAGLDPWQAPDPTRLVEELQDAVLPDLAQVMTAHPPPNVGEQVSALITHKLVAVQQVVGVHARNLNSGVADRSEISVRPLQSLGTAVACDTWASLALGFGTGDRLATGDIGQTGGYDYMVTAKWDGLLSVAIQVPWPWPWTAPDPTYITQEVDRELVAIVLSPQARGAPAAPAPLVATFGHDEGADALDEAYHSSAVLRAARLPYLPRQPHASGYALARYDKPGAGEYQLREHPLAGGWIPIGSAAPVRNPMDPPDPEVLPDTVMLRNGGLPRPITGPPNVFQYAAAATDLFGQWGPWSGAWFTLAAAAVQAPVVAAVRARAVPGPGNVDPCSLTVDGEIVWNFRERSLHELHLAVDVYVPTPPPPSPYDEPPPGPQGGSVTIANVFLTFAADGTPTGASPGVTVSHVLDDDTPVSAANPPDPDERRYRIAITGLPVTYGSQHELAVALYAQAQETIRPGEWSGWAHAREAAIAGNPLPPPVPAPLPLVYPDWASLPDAAGLSFSSVTWTPTGAWRYRVYEATEAALRAACGQPGPTLTDDLSARMQALFDLYKVPANLPKLKAAFRKLGTEPILPPLENGWMRFDSLLPRGSSLIHCYVVAGVSESNVISSWPEPDGDGRKAFHAFAIPHPRQTALPQILARLDGSGVPEVTVRLEGSVPAVMIRLYRAANAILARSIGTMELVATVPAGSTPPDLWRSTSIADAAASAGWSYLQYRAVALTTDDPEHAGMAVPSEPSRAYALLNAPPNPPTLALTPNVLGTTATVSIVKVDTDALRRGSDIGDFAMAGVVSEPGTPVLRFSSSLGTIPEFSDVGGFASGSEEAGYVGSQLYLRLTRVAGDVLGLTVDVTDPLGRSTHAAIEVPAEVPEPDPVVSLLANRLGNVVRMRIGTNVPLPPDASKDWQLEVGIRRLIQFPPSPPVIHAFAISTIPTIPNQAAMPNPATDPASFEIRRVNGTDDILMWFKTNVGVRVGVRLTNFSGSSDTAMQVVP
jgi:hypothetical protein